MISLVEKAIPKDVSWIPSHPIAGTEESGPEAGFSELFKNRWCILTPSKKAKEKDINILKSFWRRIGSKVDIMDAKQHDYILSITSHIPHLVAYNIVNTSINIQEEKQSAIIKYSAGGLRDFTRIAASNPIMWRDIFIQNRKNTLNVIKKFIANLEDLKHAIENRDGKKLEKIFIKTKKIVHFPKSGFPISCPVLTISFLIFLVFIKISSNFLLSSFSIAFFKSSRLAINFFIALDVFFLF